MTIRHISTATASKTDNVVKVWNKLQFGPHPGLDAVLPKDQAETLQQSYGYPKGTCKKPR